MGNWYLYPCCVRSGRLFGLKHFPKGPSTQLSYTLPNSNLHNYYPKPKYLIMGSFGPLGLLPEARRPGVMAQEYRKCRNHPLRPGLPPVSIAVPFLGTVLWVVPQ